MCAMTLYQDSNLPRQLDSLNITVLSLSIKVEDLQMESARVASLVTQQRPTQINNPPTKMTSYTDATKSPTSNPPSKKRKGKGGNPTNAPPTLPPKVNQKRIPLPLPPSHRFSLPQKGDFTLPGPHQPKSTMQRNITLLSSTS